MQTRWYVGVHKYGRTAFRSARTPTEGSHGLLYHACIGPFQTRRGAVFMARYGGNNPHCATVSDAERLARRDTQEKEQRT